MNSRLTVIVLAAVMVVTIGCTNHRSEDLDQWATSLCAVAEEFDVEVLGTLRDARDSPGTGREAVAGYASSVRDAEASSRQILAHAVEIDPPPSDVIEFHEAQLSSFESVTENLSMFAADMEAFLSTDDLEMLARAYPGFIARDDARAQELEPAFRSIPREAATALDAVPDCGALHQVERPQP